MLVTYLGSSKQEVFSTGLGILGQVWCLIVSIADLSPHSYFENDTPGRT